MRRERTEALPRRPAEAQHDGVRRKPLTSIPPRDLSRDLGADRALRVANRQRRAHALAALERRGGEIHQGLCFCIPLRRDALRPHVPPIPRSVRLMQQSRQVQPAGPPPPPPPPGLHTTAPPPPPP